MTEKDKSLVAPPAARPRAAGAERGPRRVRSTDLFGENDQLIIEHAGREYRLRVTSNGKLILTA